MYSNYSYWQKSIFSSPFDVGICGAGILGLMSAINIAKRNPTYRIAVFDRNQFGFGATTRNAGFACFSTVGEFFDSIKYSSHEQTLQTTLDRLLGLRLLDETIGFNNIGFERCGGYELVTKDRQDLLDKTPQLNSILSNFGVKYKVVKNTILNPSLTTHLIVNDKEGKIQSHLLMKALLQEVKKYPNIELFFGFCVKSIDSSSLSHDLHICQYLQPDGNKLHEQTMQVVCKSVVVCLNAFAPSVLKDCDITPQRNQIIVTSPHPSLNSLVSTYHARNGYVYFRTLPGPSPGSNSRLLIGGARDTDEVNENTNEFANNQKVCDNLLEFARQNIHADLRPEMSWSGIMGWSNDKNPIIKNLSSTASPLIHAHACNGMGVALAPVIAQKVSKML